MAVLVAEPLLENSIDGRYAGPSALRSARDRTWPPAERPLTKRDISACIPPATAPIRAFSLDLGDPCARLGKPVARGGFSDVFRLYSPRHGVVAVKRFRPNKDEREDLEKLVAKEARVLAMVAHPHILPFIGITHLDGDICIVTPWAENGSLGAYLKRNPEADRLELLAQVGAALNHLHTNMGDIIIHGDLHIDNVLVSDEGTALLSDFGLSRIVPAGNSSSLYRGDSNDTRIGRLVYVAPELHDGEPRSWATDVFAFGMLIFHAYSGKEPFVKSCVNVAPVAVLKGIYEGERPARSQIARRDCSEALYQLASRCWQQAPRQRPRMPEVCRELDRLLELREVSASGSASSPASSGARPPRGAQARRAVAQAAADAATSLTPTAGKIGLLSLIRDAVGAVGRKVKRALSHRSGPAPAVL